MNDQSIHPPPLHLIVSGGIGSGKSTALARLRDLGAHVIEADAVGHDVLEPGGAAYDAVMQRWPSVVTEGTIDRGALAAIVFADLAKLRLLESMTHPAIAAEIGRRVKQLSGAVAVELPVGSEMVGAGWIRIVIEAPDDLRLDRAVQRGLTEQDVRNRMASQPKPEEWRERADYLIINDGTRADLLAAVDELWAKLFTAFAAISGTSDDGGVDEGPEARAAPPDSQE